VGIGGSVRLAGLGINPNEWHINEGNPAFIVIELARARVRGGELRCGPSRR